MTALVLLVGFTVCRFQFAASLPAPVSVPAPWQFVVNTVAGMKIS